ncbi:MAG: metallophosphoesterase [Clostridia bacterium]|nr:metallophosphoesterase [Clostridia bacterium]
MIKTKKWLIAILSCMVMLCVAMAAVFFTQPKAVSADDSVLLSIDFEETSDNDNFETKTGNKWTVSGGKYNAVAWQEIYLGYAIPTTGTRIISFDAYFGTGAYPAFGIANASKLANQRPSTSGTGLFYTVSPDRGDGLLSTSSVYNAGNCCVKDYTLTRDQLVKVEIKIIEKAVSINIDGKSLYTASEINSQLKTNLNATTQTLLEDTVYLVFCVNSGTVAGTYIDNLVIRNSILGIPNEEFSNLDKLGGLHGGYDTAQITWDSDIKSLKGKMLRSVLNSVDANGDGQKYDLTGMDFLSFAINNQTGNTVKFLVELTEGSNKDINGNSVNNYGRVWTSARHTPYYLENSDGMVNGSFITEYSGIRGTMSVPAGFNGRLVIPTTSFEQLHWSANTDKNLLFSEDANAMSLGYMKWLDVYYFNDNTPDANGSLVISDPQIYGDYIPSVANSSNRVINAIDKIGVVTAASENQIAFARKWYDALDDKTAVTNYSVLETAETTFANLTDNSFVIGTAGKDFTGTEGVTLAETFPVTPTTVSAWIKVDKDVPDNTHVGTIMGVNEKTSSTILDDKGFSMEITTNGNPRFKYKVSETAKTVFVVDNVDVRTGSWLHLAFVRNAAAEKIECYVNGVKVAERGAPQASLVDVTTVRPIMIGSDYTNDEIFARGYAPDFSGCIANARVYDVVLSESEVALDAIGEKQDGILASVNFFSGEKQEYYNSEGENAKDAYAWKEVGSVEELKKGAYTFAVIPDTQMLLAKAVDSNGKGLYDADYVATDNVFYKNTKWLADNKDALGLEFVMHIGDITDTLNYDAWATKGAVELCYGLEYMNVLTDAGIPWSISRGNHDSGHTEDRLAFWDNGFSGVEVNGKTYSSTGYSGAQYGVGSQRITDLINSGELTDFGSMTESNMRNTYYKFTAGEHDWLILALDLEPTDEDIAWAKTVVESNPDRKIIVSTHAYMNKNGSFMTSIMSQDGLSHNSGQELWDEFISLYSNIVMVVSGHSSGEDIIRVEKTGVYGNKVQNFMIDYSNHEYAGYKQTGVFALFGISEDGKELSVNYYSAVENKLFRNTNQYTVPLSEILETDSTFPGQTQVGDVYLMAQHEPFENAGTGNSKDPNNYALWSNVSPQLFLSSDVIYYRKQWVPMSVSVDVDASGTFKFTSSAKIAAPTDTQYMHLAAFVTRASDGLTRKIFPASDYGAEFYTATTQSLYLSTIGDIEVRTGDRITLTFYTDSDNGKWRGANFNCGVYDNDGVTALKEYTFAVDGTLTDEFLQGLYNVGYNGVKPDGTATTVMNHNGWSIGYWTFTGGATAFYKYTVTCVDENGATLFTAKAGPNTYLPTLKKAGYVFEGYDIGGTEYKGGTNVTLSNNTTITAKFTEIVDFEIKDNFGDTEFVANNGFTGTLPVLEKSGHVFVGYMVDGKLYKAGYNYTGQETAVQAVFAQFTMTNGAAMRIAAPDGLRFISQINNSVVDLIGKENIVFGTLIAHADDIITSGTVDYSKLTIDANITKLNIVSTVQSEVGEYLNFNGSLVKIKQNHLDWDFAGRSYMTVTYADGQTATIYAQVNDNARSLGEVAEKAYNDRSAVKNATYQYLTADGNYSRFESSVLTALKKYFE